MRGGLYIHVPFCTRRCPYCDFTLIESDGSQHAAFASRLASEMKQRKTDYPEFQAETLYFPVPVTVVGLTAIC